LTAERLFTDKAEPLFGSSTLSAHFQSLQRNGRLYDARFFLAQLREHCYGSVFLDGEAFPFG